MFDLATVLEGYLIEDEFETALEGVGAEFLVKAQGLSDAQLAATLIKAMLANGITLSKNSTVMDEDYASGTADEQNRITIKTVNGYPCSTALTTKGDLVIGYVVANPKHPNITKMKTMRRKPAQKYVAKYLSKQG